MSVKVGHLYKRSVVRDLNGNIINMMDEADGGWIIRNRQIVNQDKWNQYVQKEKDKQEAKKAQTLQVNNPQAPDRTVAPSKIDALEKRINDQDAKLDAILAALKK